MRRNIFDEIHDDFRASAREFFERECVPNVEKWERDGKVSREAWLAAGAAGLIGWEFDEKYGGLGVKDFRFNQIISEEMFLTGSVGIGLGVQNDILVPYLNHLTTDEQKARWLPKVRLRRVHRLDRDVRTRGGIRPGGHQDHRA